MSVKPCKRVSQPEFTFLAIATGMMFLGAFAFFGVMTFTMFFNDGEPAFITKNKHSLIIAAPPPPLVFSPLVFASPPATRNEPPIEPDWEIENWEIGKLGNDFDCIGDVISFPRNSPTPQFRNSTTPRFPTSQFPNFPISQLHNFPISQFVTADVTFDSDGFVASVFIRPGQNLTPGQTRAVLNSAFRLHGEPDTTIGWKTEKPE